VAARVDAEIAWEATRGTVDRVLLNIVEAANMLLRGVMGIVVMKQ
jgi:hypothetical protein